MITLSQAERRIIRIAAQESWAARPIEVIEDSFDPPQRKGEDAYHTTPSGKTIVRHPNAYGWPTLYHPSTRRVEVGSRWVEYQRKCWEWPKQVALTLRQYALNLKNEKRRIVDIIAKEDCGFPIGTWRRNPEKRRIVLQACKTRRNNDRR